MSIDANRSQTFAWRFLVRRSLAVLVGAVFIYAGFLKVRDPLHFASDINNYQLIPWSVGVRFAFYLPWLEIFCGLALISRVLYRGGLFILTALMALFIVITIVAKSRGLDISCGCFGSAGSNLTLTWHLVLDGALFLALIYLWFTHEPGRVKPA